MWGLLRGPIITLRVPVVRTSVNCAVLPNPGRRDNSSLRFDDKRVRPEVVAKSPIELRGEHVEMAFDSGLYRPTCFASNKHNEFEAIQARVLAPNLELKGWDDCLAWLRENHRLLFREMHKINSVPFEEYLSRSNASPGVKANLSKTKKLLLESGIDENSHLTRSQLYQWTKRKSFIKVENDCYNSPLGRKNKAPRLIQGAPPEFICLVGPWIMAVQDLMKRRWSTKNYVCFTSGVTADKAAEFIDGGKGEWLEDDLARFDSTIDEKWCNYEVELCRRFGAPSAVLNLMLANIKTHGTSHHGWHYKCQGTRKSGDPYTSLMNSIINGVAHLYLYCRGTGKTLEECRNTVRMLVQGDDNLLRHPVLAERIEWQSGMASLGFESEAIYRARRQDVEFCSSRLYETSGGITFGPKPGRVLAKMGYIVNPPQGVSRESLMRGVALGLKQTSDFLPPVRAVIDRILQLTEGHMAWFERKQFEAFARGNYRGTCTIDTMLSLYLNYQWDFSCQTDLEVKLRGMQFGDKYPTLVTLLLDRDCGGPQQIFGGKLHRQMLEVAG